MGETVEQVRVHAPSLRGRGEVVGVHGTTAQLELAVLRAYTRASRRWDHRGLTRTSWALGRWFEGDNAVTLALGRAGRLRVCLDDGYWAALVCGVREYEPEIGHVLSAVLTPTTVFLDCGANIGLWSVLAASVIRDRRAVIAVEAASTTFRQLEANARLNDDAFLPVRAAVHRSAGETLHLATDRRRHARSTVLERGVPGARATQEEVPSTTIDDLLYDVGRTRPTVIKLDVEGVELEALEGAARTLQRGPLVVYEDHGRDASHAVTRHLVGELDMQVHAWTADGGLRRLRNPEDATAIKQRATRGYNFFACRADSPYARQLARLANGRA